MQLILLVQILYQNPALCTTHKSLEPHLLMYVTNDHQPHYMAAFNDIKYFGLSLNFTETNKTSKHITLYSSIIITVII